MNNVYCYNCKKIVKSETNKCPDCKKKGKVVGKVIKVITSNGTYESHL